MKSKKALYVFLVGLALVGICIRLKTGISTAYSKDVNGGLKAFLVYRLNDKLCGSKFSVDIFLNPIGYVLMIAGMKNLQEMNKKIKVAIGFSVIGLLVSLVRMFVPLLVSKGTLLIKITVVAYVLEGICMIIIISRFVELVKSKVDSYYNMEVGKDLGYAMELFGFSYFALIIIIFAEAIGLYFAGLLLILDYVIVIYSILYFIYKTNRYNNELKFFE